MSTNKVLLLSTLLLCLSLIAEVVFAHPHVYFWWHSLLGFDIIYGFLGCMIIIVVSKFLGKAFLQRKEDYYGNYSSEREEDDNA